MTAIVQGSSATLNDIQRDWLKKIAVVLNVHSTESAFQETIQSAQEGISSGLQGTSFKVGSDSADVDSALPGAPFQQRTKAQPVQRLGPSANDESTYRGNLAGILVRLNKALAEKPTDSASSDAHQKLQDVYDKMTVAEFDGDFVKANKFLDDLLGLLSNYEKARDAYQKAQREAEQKQRDANKNTDARNALEQRYDEYKDRIDDAIKNPANDFDAGNFGVEIEKLKQDYDAARMSDDIDAASKHLANIIRKLNAKLAEVSAAYSKNIADVATDLSPQSDSYYYPNHPVYDIRKQVNEARTNLGTISRYIIVNSLVTQFKQKLAAYKKQQAESEKNRPKQIEEEKKRDAQSQAALQALKAQLDKAADSPYPPAGDPKSVNILEQLKKWKTDWDAALRDGWPFPTAKYGSAFPTSGVEEINGLLKSYTTTSEAFWKQAYENGQKTNEAEVKSVLSRKVFKSQSLKSERDKLEALSKELDTVAASKDYYQSNLKLSQRDQQLFKFKSVEEQIATDKKNYEAAFAKIRMSVDEALSRDWKSKEMTKLQDGVSAKKAEMEAAANNEDYKQAIKHAGALGTLADAFNHTKPWTCTKVNAAAIRVMALIQQYYFSSSAKLDALSKAYDDALEDHQDILKKLGAQTLADQIFFGLFLAALGGGAGGALAVGLKKFIDDKSATGGYLIDASKDVAKFTTRTMQQLGKGDPLAGANPRGSGSNIVRDFGRQLKLEGESLSKGVGELAERVLDTNCGYEDILIEGDPVQALRNDPFLKILDGLPSGDQASLKPAFAKEIWGAWIDEYGFYIDKHVPIIGRDDTHVYRSAYLWDEKLDPNEMAGGGRNTQHMSLMPFIKNQAGADFAYKRIAEARKIHYKRARSDTDADFHPFYSDV